MTHVLEYLKANWQWLVPLLAVILTNIANGLSNHPREKGILLGLSRILDQLPTTILAKAGAPGQTLKLPLAASNWPADHPLNPAMVPSSNDTTSKGPRVVGALIWWVSLTAIGAGAAGITAASIAACNAAQKAGWGAVGQGILHNCATLGNAAKIAQDIETEAGLPGATAQSVAEAVAVSDGVDLALCAFGQIVAYGGALLGAEETHAHQLAYEAAQWGLSHKDELRATVAAKKATLSKPTANGGAIVISGADTPTFSFSPACGVYQADDKRWIAVNPANDSECAKLIQAWAAKP